MFIQGNPLRKKIIPFSRFKCAIFIEKIIVPFKRFIHNLAIYIKKKKNYFTPRVRTVCAVMI